MVDAIRAFTDPSSPLGSDYTGELAVIARLLVLARQSANAWPVFFSTVSYTGPDQARVFREKLPDLNLLQQGSDWVEVDEGLTVAQGDEVLVKHHASCFHGTDLDRRLSALGVDSLLITGFTTSGCVRASAVDALQYGLRVTVVSDGVGDRDSAAHRANLADIERKYGDVTPLAEIARLAAAAAEG